jgi:hypothetical protein
MKRNPKKKSRIRTASVGKTPTDEVTLNANSGQSDPSSIAPPDPLEIGLATIRGERHAKKTLYVGILSVVVMVFCAWFFSPRERGPITVNLPSQQPATSGQPESNTQRTSSPSNLAQQAATPTRDSNKPLTSSGQTRPAGPAKSSNAALIAEHLAQAKSLKSHLRYSEALIECDKALQINREDKKAQALAAKIILAENDKPKQ